MIEMNKRIRLNGGHSEISIEGYKYMSDETGAFEVPEQYTDELLRIHGGKYDPGVAQLEENVRAADDRVAATRHLLDLQITDAKTCRENLDKYKKEQSERIAAGNAATVVSANKQQPNNQQQPRR
jgi:hypothetical protein